MPITRTWTINETTGRQEVTCSGSYGPVADTNDDTAGATLVELETEVNELKATLRANGLLTE